MASSNTKKQANKMIGSAGQATTTLRRPVTVIKKRSGPLDGMIDELKRAEDATTTITTNVSTTNRNPNSNANTNVNSNSSSKFNSNVSDSNQMERERATITWLASGRNSPTSAGRRRCHTKEKEKKRERWLLTRKTWRYMTDAGRKLLPDGIQHGADSLPHIEEQFQRVCSSEQRFILWRRKSSFPGASKNSRKRLKLLSRHRSSYAAYSKSGESELNENVDQTIELLQTYLKIRDSYKTTTLLGTKTVRPDQTSSPSSQRPNYGKSLLSSKSSSSSSAAFDSNSISNEQQQIESVLLERLKFLKSSSLSVIQIGNVTPEILEDKAHLRKIYNILKKQQLHRILHSSEPKTKSNLSGATSFSSLFNFNTNYENNPTELCNFEESKAQNPILEGHHDLSAKLLQSLKTKTQTTTTKRQQIPPESLELIHSTRNISNKTPIGYARPVQKSTNSCGTQTNFIQLSEIKILARNYELMLENSELSEAEEGAAAGGNSSRRRSSIDNEDVSQSVSDTIKRYLRMARKKSVHDGDASRFKSVNYDRNLRNIKAKGEINPPGMDEDNHKAVQTLDAWALVALDFIRGNENPRNLQNAHIAWQKELDERIRKRNEWEMNRQQERDNEIANQSKNHFQPASAPTSPTRSMHSPKEKTGKTAGALLSSSSQFLSNLWNTNPTEQSTSQNYKNGNVNETYLNSKNETTNMQKSKSLSNVGQYVSRKIWGSRSKCQSRQDHSQDFLAQREKWVPSENCTWISTQGQILQLTDTSLEKLSDVEAEMLMHIALEKIKELNIGMNIDLQRKAPKRRVISKKRALTTSFFDIGKKDENNGRDILFGAPLENCLSRDRKRAGDSECGSKHSLTSVFHSNNDNRCRRGGQSNDNIRSYESLPTKSLDCGRSSPSEQFMELKKSSSISKKMSCSQFDMRHVELDLDRILFEESKNSFMLNVPIFVMICIEYLEEHGLQKVGLFRVGTSKKRVKQLRDEFDRNNSMCIPDNTCPHDVATLLKEFLRDLPEPLLCKRLYTAFLETQRIRNRRLQLEAISHLIKLLPIVHRDTLYVLLKFLGNVAAHCDDICARDGTVQVIGNKMDSNNLSTVFAPNILRDSTPKAAEYKEQGNMGDAINVIRIMIDHCEEIFKVPVEIMDVLYSHMLDTCPEKLYDLIINKVDQSLSNQIESSTSIRSPVHLSDASYNSAILSDERRQSTPVLLDHLNVFSARLQISVPAEGSLQIAKPAALKESKIQSVTTEPKLPASISNIGGATMHAKTAEFEKTPPGNNTIYNGTQMPTSKARPLYKRQQLIPSARRRN
ncbi:uncharacterized protein LOC6570327 [Drosophila grimshawi]|uniref:uncharacterized protein LOC6570327 n=1 Tax=Drosophila grimshawi TaxID=7222 RepID=UPI000C86EAFC|nr:uncharacterized protein LOC6570327 [Drosophila grimshawi]